MNSHNDPDIEPVVLAVRPELCLDYANTRYWRGSETPTESLAGVDDLLDWLGRHAELPATMIARARREASRDAAGAEDLFAEAVALREAVYRIFSAIAVGGAAADHDLGSLNRALAAAPPRRRLVRRDGGYGWEIELGATGTNLLAPVLWSASDLLLNASERRIRRCANERCWWLFVDTSKSGTRRWCDMGACGNRAKAARHYAKVRRAKSG